MTIAWDVLVTIAMDVQATIAGDVLVTIAMDVQVTIAGDVLVTIAMDVQATIAWDVLVTGNYSHGCAGDYSRECAGNYSHGCAGNYSRGWREKIRERKLNYWPRPVQRFAGWLAQICDEFVHASTINILVGILNSKFRACTVQILLTRCC